VEYKDYYKVFGVERDASQDEIKKKFRKLARMYHPDIKKDDPEAEKRFKEVNEAYEVLGDAEKRKRYDDLGSNWQDGQDFRPPPGYENIFGQEGFGSRRGKTSGRAYSFEYGPESRGGGAFSDFFETIFGDLGMERQGRPQSSRFRGKGSDLETEAIITLQEAHRGTTREIEVQGPDGAKRLSVKIPAGTHDGMKIRLGGQGNAGPGGSGDIYLKIRLAPDPRFKIEGSDLIMELPVCPWDAALGATQEIETLDGKLSLKIPAEISSGQRLRLQGKGLGNKGDLYVQIKIVTLKNLTTEEKRLFTELKKAASSRDV
jgi:curved DNA-binding protein